MSEVARPGRVPGRTGRDALPFVNCLAMAMLTVALATSPAAAQTAAPAGASTAGAVTAADFVRQAANSDMFETRSSQMALDKTQDAQVRAFAQRMVQDHGQAEAQLKAAAKKETVPTSPDAEHAQMLQRLQGLSGNDFTQAYLQMQQQGHMRAIDLFQAYAQNGSDGDLKQFAQQTLPTLREHQRLLNAIPGAGTAQNGGGTPSYVTTEAPGVWRASKLVGLNVYNQGGDKVGDINEVLLNRDGSAQAVVIGVGGFLGIGERDVAVPFSAMHWEMTAYKGNAVPPPASNGVLPPVAGGTTAPVVGAPDRTYPDHATLPNASRDQLRNAPEFHYAGTR